MSFSRHTYTNPNGRMCCVACTKQQQQQQQQTQRNVNVHQEVRGSNQSVSQSNGIPAATTKARRTTAREKQKRRKRRQKNNRTEKHFNDQKEIRTLQNDEKYERKEIKIRVGPE